MALKIVKIKEILLSSVNLTLTAIVVHKKEKFMFKNKTGDIIRRGTITFMLRDSRQDTILCKLFGEEAFIKTYDESIHLFSQIDVVCPRVVPLNAATLSFNPRTSSSFYFVINEGFGGSLRTTSIAKSALASINRACHQPISPLAKCLNLSEINNFEVVNVLVSVAFLPQSASNNCLNVLVADMSCPKGIVLTLWNEHWINRALTNWNTTKSVILHIIDGKVSYSNYYQAFVLSQNAKTAIFENPWDKVATNLRQWSDSNGGSIDPTILDGPAKSCGEEVLGNITVEQLYEKLDHYRDIWYNCEILGKITMFQLDNALKVIWWVELAFLQDSSRVLNSFQ